MPLHSQTYTDPSEPKRIRPSLIGGLMGLAATWHKHPLENQVSEALAWLIDRSAVLAETTVRLFLEEDDANEALVAAGGCIGASTQNSLAALPGDTAPCYFPDIWIAGAHRSFQLIIEAKVDASLHHIRVASDAASPAFPHTQLPPPDGQGVIQILQHDAYRLAWSAVPPAADAERRYVGVISLTPPAPSTTGEVVEVKQARSVTWAELLERFSAADVAERIEPGVELVLSDFLHAVRVRVLRTGPVVSDAEAERVLSFGRQLLAAARADETWVPATKTSFGRVVATHNYVGFHMRFQPPGDPETDVHLYITHAAGHLALVEEPEPAAYVLVYQSGDQGTDQRYLSTWRYGSDRKGYQGWRRVLPLSAVGWTPDAEAPPAEALAGFTAWLRESIESCGLG